MKWKGRTGSRQGVRKEAAEERNLLKAGPKKDTLTYYEDASNKADASALYYRTILDKSRIVSPITGKVIRKYLQRGEMVSKEFQPYLVAVADVERVRINAEVDETDVGKFKASETRLRSHHMPTQERYLQEQSRRSLIMRGSEESPRTIQ